jgi:hypothetical protein
VADNYITGIQIPIYVVVFGIVGGYLRYLYTTAKLIVRKKPLGETYLFSWDNVPGKDSNKLRDFLKTTFDIDWIKKQDFEKENQDKITIKDSGHFVTITLDGSHAKLAIDSDRATYEFVVRNGKDIYHTVTRRMWLFYESLEDLSLLFLAPLLAIAVWFILTQAGTTATHTIALASIAVGLVTEDIVRRLIKTTRSSLGDGNNKENEYERKPVSADEPEANK